MDKNNLDEMIDFTIEFWILGFVWLLFPIWILPYGIYELYKRSK